VRQAGSLAGSCQRAEGMHLLLCPQWVVLSHSPTAEFSQ